MTTVSYASFCSPFIRPQIRSMLIQSCDCRQSLTFASLFRTKSISEFVSFKASTNSSKQKKRKAVRIVEAHAKVPLFVEHDIIITRQSLLRQKDYSAMISDIKTIIPASIETKRGPYKIVTRKLSLWVLRSFLNIMSYAFCLVKLSFAFELSSQERSQLITGF